MIFNLEEKEIAFIVGKLGKFPMEEVEPIVAKIRQQANNQPQPKQRKPAETASLPAPALIKRKTNGVHPAP